MSPFRLRNVKGPRPLFSVISDRPNRRTPKLSSGGGRLSFELGKAYVLPPSAAAPCSAEPPLRRSEPRQ
jgi:hypothetical protein